MARCDLRIAIDSSVLVALINPRDVWRERALALHNAMLATGNDLLYFDCVVAESVSAAVRRLYEKGRTDKVEALLDRLGERVPHDTITWILPDTPRLYPDALELIRSSSGAMNFNDALIALACQERDIPAIASFDDDFDALPWLRRLAQPEDVTP